MAATRLPVLVDCDTGYGDVKNVTRTIQGYEAHGRVGDLHGGPGRAQALRPHGRQGRDPRRRDGARRSAPPRPRGAARDFFIIARTDARAVHGLDEALRRGEMYLEAGADGLFIEAPQTVQELERVGRAFQGVPQIANMLEGGGQTPVLPPAELYRLGFNMVAYPTTLIFRVARTIEKALADIKAGTPAAGNEGVDFADFKDITGFAEWARVDDTYGGRRGASRHDARDGSARGARAGAGGRVQRRPARRPRCGSRSAASRRCSICRSPSPSGSATSRTRASTSRFPISPAAARALQALIGGSADVVTGAFDHTIQMHAKGQPIVAVIELGHFPGFVLARAVGPRPRCYRGPADLKGMKIGITAPGSSTHFMVRYLMAQARPQGRRCLVHRHRRRRRPRSRRSSAARSTRWSTSIR